MTICKSAPRLEIDLSKIHHNASTLVKRLALQGISVTGMTKAMLGLPEFSNTLIESGISALGDSRIQNIARMQGSDVGVPMILTRSPMLSQIEYVVTHVDISFNTEIDVIRALSREAKRVGKTHGIVLMVELGDLREGIMPQDIEHIVCQTLELPNLEFKGIGTNLACRSGVSPDTKNMAVLSSLADAIDAIFGFEMEIVSGGNSANLAWVFSGAETGRINNLRLGESILLGLNPLNRQPIDGLYTDAFKLIAEVIEAKEKPSHPWGDIAQAAFGTSQPITKQGNTSQIILALGEQDTDSSGLTPLLDVEILGASSDHLILDSTSHNLSIGNEVAFQVNYSALVRAMTSPFIVKTISG